MRDAVLVAFILGPLARECIILDERSERLGVAGRAEQRAADEILRPRKHGTGTRVKTDELLALSGRAAAPNIVLVEAVGDLFAEAREEPRQQGGQAVGRMRLVAQATVVLRPIRAITGLALVPTAHDGLTVIESVTRNPRGSRRARAGRPGGSRA
jgi:hypothetical protein